MQTSVPLLYVYSNSTFFAARSAWPTRLELAARRPRIRVAPSQTRPPPTSMDVVRPLGRCTPAASRHREAARASHPRALRPRVARAAGVAHSPTSTHEHGRSTSNKFWEGRRVPAVVCVVRRRVAPHRQDLAGFSLDAGGHASSLDSVDALLRSAISRASSGDPAAAQAPTSCSAREPLPTRTLSSTRVCSRQPLVFALAFGFGLARPPLRRIFTYI